MGLTAHFFGIAALTTAALADAALDPAALLSRYPAGAVPDSSEVHLAIDALASEGDPDSLSLLDSLTAHESGAVELHAGEARSRVASRVLAHQRHEAARRRPSDRDLQAWISDHPELGSDVTVTEKRVIAYAALATQGATWTDGQVGDLTPLQSSLQTARAEELELAGRFESALPIYVNAALSGDARAVHALMARGVDMHRLALGLSSEHGQRAGLPRLNTAPVVRSADPAAVSVLIGRAEGSTSLPRLAALENLGVLLRNGELDPAQARRVRRALLLATRDALPAIRHTAQSALTPAVHP